MRIEDMSDSEREEPGGLGRSGGANKIWHGLIVACGVLVVIGAFTKSDAHYAIERIPGVLEILGFVGFILVVLGAKALRTLIMRDETYYDRD
jgi:hypothetical protein